jgi:hypothetical protein
MHGITEQELSNYKTKDWDVSGCAATQIFPKDYTTQGELQCAPTEHIMHSPPNIMAAYNTAFLTIYGIKKRMEKITSKKFGQKSCCLINRTLNNRAPLQSLGSQIKKIILYKHLNLSKL